MPRFFVSTDLLPDVSDEICVCGDDAVHISRSLRMAVGDRLTLCDGREWEFDCVISRFEKDRVICTVTDRHGLLTEPPFSAVIYQALPKGDKLDTVIQKSTECGATALVTFESEFCIAREKSDSADRKLERRRRIAVEAAKQCGRGVVPEIFPTVGFEEAINEASKSDIPIFCYEGADTVPLAKALKERRALLRDNGEMPNISVVIGSEGGFSSAEARYAKENGMLMVGLGARIMRTETVASFVLACLSYEFEL